MSQSQNHKIHTTALQVDFEGMDGGLGLQDKLAQVFYEKLKPALEKEFDDLVDSKTTLEIDSLVLDCGFLTGDDWEEKLLQNLLGQVRKELARNKYGKHNFTSKESKASEVFFFFLEKGYFPWNSPFSSPVELENAIELNQKFIAKLDITFQKSSFCRNRLFSSFSQKFTTKIFEWLGKESNPRIPILFQTLQKEETAKTLKEMFLLFLPFGSKKHKLSTKKLIQTVISSLDNAGIPALSPFFELEVKKDPEFQEAFASVISEPINQNFALKIKFLLKIIERRSPEIIEDLKLSKTKIAILGDQNNFSESVKQDHPDSENPIDKIPVIHRPVDKENTLNSKEEIYIENAGLVILHPYIKGLFENLKLTENRKFIDSSAQNSGVKILQFLVYGDTDLPENYLVLNKLICGMGVFESVTLKDKITEESKNECEELLQNVIAHWEILKNTSVDGLRETFLQRNGKLTRVDKGWKLKVERKTVDILMDKLPWGIGHIKLPWMSEMMYVDWN